MDKELQEKWIKEVDAAFNVIEEVIKSYLEFIEMARKSVDTALKMNSEEAKDTVRQTTDILFDTTKNTWENYLKQTQLMRKVSKESKEAINEKPTSIIQ